jgi:hypothetical protein
MTTVMRTVLPLRFDYRTQALVAVLTALVVSLLLGPHEAAAWVKGGG